MTSMLMARTSETQGSMAQGTSVMPLMPLPPCCDWLNYHIKVRKYIMGEEFALAVLLHKLH